MVLQISFQEIDFLFGLPDVQTVQLAVHPNGEKLFAGPQEALDIFEGGFTLFGINSSSPRIVDHQQIRCARKKKKADIKNRCRNNYSE